MQQQRLNELVENKNIDFPAFTDKVKKETKRPVGARTPSENELKKIQAYAKEYKAKKPKASNREIRRAVEKKFNAKVVLDN